jgi:hypothetical protein
MAGVKKHGGTMDYSRSRAAFGDCRGDGALTRLATVLLTFENGDIIELLTACVLLAEKPMTSRCSRSSHPNSAATINWNGITFETLPDRSPTQFSDTTAFEVTSRRNVGMETYVKAKLSLDQLRRTAPTVFKNIDALLTPTTSVPPPRVSQLPSTFDDVMALDAVLFRNTSPFNLLAFPHNFDPARVHRLGPADRSTTQRSTMAGVTAA